MKQSIAIQGERASFHDMAATKYFGREMPIQACESFHDVFSTVNRGEVEYGITAIENTLYGSIVEVYDLLLKNDMQIVGEIYLHINQCLIGLPGTSISDIKVVYSHPVALAQCEEYLDSHVASAVRIEQHDTAASVRQIKARGDKHAGAIGGRVAAEYHGLEILADAIETDSQNYTRFVVLKRQGKAIKDANKTSLVMTTSGESGSLYKALGVFALAGINLTKLQSRPLIGQAWRYRFYLDVAEGMQSSRMKRALDELQDCTLELKVLGSYKSGSELER